MEQPLVSVIVPIYNVEQYLNHCIETITAQTYEKMEILLIDDGATDNSSTLCEQWKEKDNRITVIHKQNSGLGFARNTGLDHAHGQYVMFVDSDDFCNLNAVETLVKNGHGADTVFCGHSIYYSENDVVHFPIRYEGAFFETEDILYKILLEMIGGNPEDPSDIVLPISVWHGLYSMEIINKYKIRFPSERQFISEDMIFHIDYLAHSKRVQFVSDCLYYYRKNNGLSLTTVYNASRFDKEIILYKEVDRRLGTLLPENIYRLRLQRTFLGRVRSCIMRATKQIEKPAQEIRKICENKTVQEVLKEYPFNHNPLKLRVFNYCIKHRLVLLLQLMVYLRSKKV